MLKEFKILIVDDDVAKSRSLSSCLSAKCSIDPESILLATNMRDALKVLKAEHIDILLLDLLLPPSLVSEPASQGGVQLINRLMEDQSLCFPRHIVGITGEESEFLQSQVQAYPFPVIKYSATGGAWQEALASHVRCFAKQLGRAKSSTNTLADVAIVTALEHVELESILNSGLTFSPLPCAAGEVFNYHQCKIKIAARELTLVAVACPRMGLSSAAVTTASIIEKFRPQLVCMTGIAAGVHESGVALGDILVAEYCWDWGAGKRVKDASGNIVVRPDYQQERIDQTMEVRAKRLKGETGSIAKIAADYPGAAKPSGDLRVHIGPLASGASVLNDGLTVSDLTDKQNRKLMGVDMETYGFYLACRYARQPSPHYISIKSVTDYADGQKSDDFQHYAAYTSAQFALKFITENADLLKER